MVSSIESKILSFLFSKSGVAVRWAVGMIIAGVAKQHVFPDADLAKIQGGLLQGGYAVAALGYGGLQVFLAHRNQKQTVAVQQAVNSKLPVSQQIKEDGHLGVETLRAIAATTNLPIPVRRAIPVNQ